MFYQKLTFPKVERSSRASRTKNRPFFYTNFVSTLDGKVAVKRSGYWPIGSKSDYRVLEELRMYADCLIHGGNLGRQFGEITVKSINKSIFKQMRRVLGKSANLPYYIITSQAKTIKKSPGVKLFHLPGELRSHLGKLVKELQEKGYKNVLVEGGPTLLGSFLKENLIDEVFLTLTPKIYGSQEGITSTLVEGILFSPQQIKILKLVSLKKIGNEVFLRYSLKKG